jgi:predicted nucleic acid-binding protein
MALVVVLDASVVIAFLDSRDSHHAAATAALTAHRSDDFVLPASVYAEILVAPLRRGSEAFAKARQAMTDLGIRMQPLTTEVAERAALLRARHGSLRFPDALVLATGEALEADAVLTADRAWPRVSRRARVV